MRRLWAAGAATLLSLVVGGAPGMAQSPPASMPPGMAAVTGTDTCDFTGFPVITCTEVASDPRVNGTATRTITLEPPTADQGALMWNDVTLTGPEGTWTGEGYGVMLPDGTIRNVEIMSGSGAYQGLVYATAGTVGPDGSATYGGLIQEGSLPPGFPVASAAMPSPAPSK
jgi:hypothetical protein